MKISQQMDINKPIIGKCQEADVLRNEK